MCAGLFTINILYVHVYMSSLIIINVEVIVSG